MSEESRSSHRLRSRLGRMRQVSNMPEATPEHTDDARFSALRASLRYQYAHKERKRTGSLEQAKATFCRYETEQGIAYVRRTTFPLSHRHGKAPIVAAREVRPKTLADLTLDDGLHEIEFNHLCFVDTETTGLAGGAGTIPFLTGLSWFEGEQLVVLQVVVLDPSEERAALCLVSERLGLHRGLVSFNGKSFDWPLLRTRFLLGRVACAAPRAHVDLLHVARRMLAHETNALPDRRLQTLERAVLGFEREDDLPGAQIPEVYQRFLRERDPALLEPVLEHNLHDLVALPALLSHFAQLFSHCDENDIGEGQLWALAQLCSRRGQAGRAAILAQRCVDKAEDVDLQARARLFLARLERQQGNLDGQKRHLKAALAQAPRDKVLRAQVHLAYAKYLEHSAKCYSDALVHARASALIEGEDGVLKRVKRLERRLASVSSSCCRPRSAKTDRA